MRREPLTLESLDRRLKRAEGGYRVHGLKDCMTRDDEKEHIARLYRNWRDAENPVPGNA